ncbi:hypothetical protein VNO77_00519 [Canavalia gladiata]|uniref:Uncharacterized protein n=1 Tax=Canavalia gladiata TaxID=3824 RepID=A0AAN9MPJ7_CANGL
MTKSHYQKPAPRSTSQPQCHLHAFIHILVGDVGAAQVVGNRNRFKSTKSLPKRGQIKSKIVANAFHSIASVIYRASLAGLRINA